MAESLALPTERPTPGRGRFDARRVMRDYSFTFGLVLALGLLIANVADESGGFGLTNQLADVAPLAIAALASTPAIIGGGFDISISPLIFCLNSVFIVWLAPAGLAGAVSVPILLGLGCAVGAFSGLLIVFLRVQPVVVTLAMYFILQGVDLVLSPQPQALPGHGGWTTHLAGTIAGIPGGIFTIGVPLLIWIGLRYVPFRRYLYAIGSNETTAFSSGVNVNTVRIASYALGGLFAAIAALALTGLVSTTDAPQSTEYTLPAIAAVALGGTSLAGGRGGLTGALYGAFAIYLLQNLLATLQIDPAYLQIVYGGTLVVAVVIGGRLTLGAKARSHRTPRRFGGERAAVVDQTQESRILAVGEVSRPEPAGAGERRHVTIWMRLSAIQARYPVIQLLAVAAVYLYGVDTLPALGDWSSIKSLLLLAGLTGLASAGQTLLILMGGFDLGVAGFIVTGAVSVTALQGIYHIPFLVAMTGAVVGSAILGAIAGNVCHRYRIQPLIVTLAMGTIAVGLVEIQNGGTATGSAQPWLAGIAEPISKTFGVGLPPIVAIWIVLAIIFFLFLQRTVTGRWLFATGANERAAEYALINTRKVWTLTFAFSAGAAALVGVLICGYAGGVTSTLGDSYLFGSVVAVIVGGTIFGGPGNYTRTCVGALFVTVLTEVLIAHGASAATTQIVQGAIILLAITAYGRQRRLRDRL
jgi:ribose transport system permease protein